MITFLWCSTFWHNLYLWSFKDHRSGALIRKLSILWGMSCLTEACTFWVLFSIKICVLISQMLHVAGFLLVASGIWRRTTSEPPLALVAVPGYDLWRPVSSPPPAFLSHLPPCFFPQIKRKMHNRDVAVIKWPIFTLLYLFWNVIPVSVDLIN